MKYLLLFILSATLVNCKSPNAAKDASQPTQNAVANPDNTKPAAELVGTYWKLTELMGKGIVVDTSSAMSREPHMILQASDSTVKGHGGCNGFGGNYEWKAPNRIKFDKIVSTMMACEQLQTENSFFETLRNADNYYIIGDTLILNKARMAPLARFVAVYMK
jgi:heat shock protein HslJ